MKVTIPFAIRISISGNPRRHRLDILQLPRYARRAYRYQNLLRRTSKTDEEATADIFVGFRGEEMNGLGVSKKGRVVRECDGNNALPLPLPYIYVKSSSIL